MSSNLGQFLLQIDAMKLKLETIPDEVCRGAVIEFTERVVEDTPQDLTDPDTVSVRGDYTGGVNSVPGAVDRGDPSGEASKKDIKEAVSSWRPSANDTFYIAHHSPYIRLLEYGLYNHATERTTASGYSSQAPQGFVAIHVVEFDDIVKEQMAKHSLL